MADQDLSQSRLGQIAVVVKDLDRAVAFYRDTLGMRFLFQAPPKLAFFDCGGVRLLLDVPEEEEFKHPASILYYKVEDIKATWTALRGRGVDFRDEPHMVARMPDHELWMTFFRDTEGNTLALMSEVRG
ncbi:MAG TPA: VOC family protein [Thermoanaerobaculia bacterium]|nr:VOC family protein [Thermoanaerobaculia bacterium]